jgi:hypothetical protein
MSEKSQTPDERLMMKLYESAMANGDPFFEIDWRYLAPKIGQKEIAMKNMVKLLAQANLIQKNDEYSIQLTQRGCDFVLDALEENRS